MYTSYLLVSTKTSLRCFKLQLYNTYMLQVC